MKFNPLWLFVEVVFLRTRHHKSCRRQAFGKYNCVAITPQGWDVELRLYFIGARETLLCERIQIELQARLQKEFAVAAVVDLLPHCKFFFETFLHFLKRRGLRFIQFRFDYLLKLVPLRTRQTQFFIFPKGAAIAAGNSPLILIKVYAH